MMVGLSVSRPEDWSLIGPRRVVVQYIHLRGNLNREFGEAPDPATEQLYQQLVVEVK